MEGRHRIRGRERPRQAGAPRPYAELSWVVGDKVVGILELSFTRPQLLAESAVETKFSTEELDALNETWRPPAESYNEAIDNYCNEVASIEEAHSLSERADVDAVEVTLELSNLGTAPLEGAHIFVTLPTGFTFTDDDHPVDKPDLPRRPVRPKEVENQLYGGFGIDTSRLFRSIVFEAPTFDSGKLLALARGLSNTQWGLELDDGNQLTGWRKKLTHNLHIRFEDVVRVIPPQTVGTFRADYKIIADNLPVPQRGTLEIVVVEAPAPEPSDDG